jgi:hypothetical protein
VLLWCGSVISLVQRNALESKRLNGIGLGQDIRGFAPKGMDKAYAAD